MKKYNLSYLFKDTEQEASDMCKKIDLKHTRYARKKHPSTYTAWCETKGKFKGFVVIYWG